MGNSTGKHFLQENITKKKKTEREREKGNGKVQIEKDWRDISIN